jgi:CopG family nickel-responsive transcriptional regulator
MHRITISLDENLVAQFERYLDGRGYQNRSEAIRDLIREKLEAERLEQGEEDHCVGTLTYIYNHTERELSRRLTQAQHRHHDIAVSTVHVHLDHDHCMETVMMRGPTAEVREFANATIAQPGVRHGKLHLIPVQVEEGEHSHGAPDNSKPHAHARPRT